jgi:hypothetical protein
MGTLKSIIAGVVAIAATLVSVAAGPVSASADTGGHPDFTAQARNAR